jgi:hypothetical protein
VIKILLESQDMSVEVFPSIGAAKQWLLGNKNEWYQDDKICLVDFKNNTCEFYKTKIELVKLD